MAGELNKMKVTELRAELQKKGLSTAGKKMELVIRLQARLDEEEFGLDLAGGAASTTPTKKAAETTDASSDAAAIKKEEPKDAVDTKEEKEEEEEAAADDDKPADGEEEAKPEAAAAPAAVTPVKKEASPEKKADPVAPKPATKGSTMTFEEKKRLRAQRFGIPVVTQKGANARGGKNNLSGGNSNTRSSKRQRMDSDKASNPFEELSEEELKKRLKRAEEFNVKNDRVDAMKAALRKIRFATN